MAPTLHTDALPPMVFMCGCSNVLGDSFDFVCSVEALQSVTLRGVSGLQVDKIVQRGSLLADLDSTYLAVTCRKCGTAVGRRYVRVPDELQLMAMGFTLSTDLLQRRVPPYALGSSELRIAGSGAALSEHAPTSPNTYHAMATPSADVHPADDGGASSVVGAAAAAGPTELEARVELLEADLIKVQNILLLHDERLEGLEACASAPQPGQGPPDRPQRLAAGAMLSDSALPMR